MSEKQGHKQLKTGLQHYAILLALLLALTYGFYAIIIPKAVQTAVLALFHPHDERLKENFKEIMPNVHAVASDKFTQSLPSGTENIRPYIRTDYIFDFTSDRRSEREDGYSKAENEWIVKASGEGGLGDSAIILEPIQGFMVLAIVLGFAFAIVVTFFLPSSIGFMALKVDREIHHTRSKIRLQTGFPDTVVDYLTLPDNQLNKLDPGEVRSAFRIVWDRTAMDPEAAAAHGKRMLHFDDVFVGDLDLVEFRSEVLYLRLREFFSDFVLKEIEDSTGGIEWSHNRSKFFKGLRLYMAHHFTEKYSNAVTGFAYFGAAILIVVIGIRGLKFIPATKPSLILAAISLEGCLLALLAFSLVYTESEERMDKMLKKMEDANNNQLDTMRDVKEDMHAMSQALIGGTSEMIRKKVEEAISASLSSDENVRKIVSDKVSERIIIGIKEGFGKS